MMEVAINLYKDLFKKENRHEIQLAAEFWKESEKVTNEENNALTTPFIELEMKEAVLSCYADGATGSDGISFLFYHKFWDVLQKEVVNMFNDFFRGKLDLYRLNFAMLTLIP
jgi:hypothetical protein